MRPARNPRDRLFAVLRDIERRLGRLERPSRNFVALSLAPDGSSSGSSGSYVRCFAGLGAGTYSRLAYCFSTWTNAGTADLRLVARNGSSTIELATFSTSSASASFRTGNVELPETVQDGAAWTFEVQAKQTTGAGPWNVRGYALILTNDPELELVEPS